MPTAIKNNILFLIFVLLTLNVLAISAAGAYYVLFPKTVPEKYETIDCAGAAGRVHKCIRIDPTAGEVNDAGKGASYRVIYGQ